MRFLVEERLRRREIDPWWNGGLSEVEWDLCGRETGPKWRREGALAAA